MGMNKKVISALIGLVGAIQNNGKTASTDATIRAALLSQSDNCDDCDGNCQDNCDDDCHIEAIHQEKFKISPGCASCEAPCGNTSDYPMEAFDEWSEEQKVLKEQIMDEILRIVGSGNSDAEIPDIVLKGIAYIGYDLEGESYRKLLEDLKRSRCSREGVES